MGLDIVYRMGFYILLFLPEHCLAEDREVRCWDEGFVERNEIGKHRLSSRE